VIVLLMTRSSVGQPEGHCSHTRESTALHREGAERAEQTAKAQAAETEEAPATAGGSTRWFNWGRGVGKNIEYF
jgi:hypothetical protein